MLMNTETTFVYETTVGGSLNYHDVITKTEKTVNNVS